LQGRKRGGAAQGWLHEGGQSEALRLTRGGQRGSRGRE
jgi:hypothetical protein